MKLLLISEYYPPHWTGLSKAFYYMAKQLEGKGHEITVLTTQFEHNLKKDEVVDNIRIKRSPFLFRFSRTHYSIAILKDAFSLYRFNEAVIINSPNSNILPLTLLGKLLKKRVIIFHQGDLSLPQKTGFFIFNRLIEFLFDILTVSSMLFADKVSTYTEDYAKQSRVMKGFMHKFFAYIPPITLSTKTSSAAFLKKITTIKKNHILIGFAGRFVEEKGFDILYQAIPQVVKAIPNVHFVFAGQTEISYEPFIEKNKKLIEQNKKHVTFLGLLDEADLAQFYKSLAVFVMSSRSDCFGLTQVEAALAGVPIVVTDIPGARILVQETGCGVVVKPEDPYDLAQGIIEVLSFPTRSGIHTINIDSHFRENDNVILFIKKYETFFLN